MDKDQDKSAKICSSNDIAGFPCNQYNEERLDDNNSYPISIKWEKVENIFQEENNKNLTGYELIAEFVKTLPLSSGVYRMLNRKAEVLYVGKAKQLKKRVQNYTSPLRNTKKINRMISETYHMEFIITDTETEALLLEANLIKQLKPKYNFLLRDDKSFPYIYINSEDKYPGVFKKRGQKEKNGKYYGPFASVSAVSQTIHMLQKAFLLRTCSDSTLNARTRPCLLYQIKRCSAPCMDKISPSNYLQLVEEAEDVLSGKSDKIQKNLVSAMMHAAEQKQYETAALYRDRLAALSHVQSHQNVNIKNLNDTDIIVMAEKENVICIQIFFFRSEQNWGNRSYFPQIDNDMPHSKLLADFIIQFYADKYVPKEILLSQLPDEEQLIKEALSYQKGQKISINLPAKGSKKDLVQQCLKNAQESLQRKLNEEDSQRQLFETFAKVFNISKPIRRIEIYDNSHLNGTNQVGVMVVAGINGFAKNQYRKYNIKLQDGKTGDDLAMMKEVIYRRFSRLLNETDTDNPDELPKWPDVLLIDGGQTQFNVVTKTLEELNVQNKVSVIGIAKGRDRNAGKERFFTADQSQFTLEPRSPLLFFVQRLRDEAHRFAIQTQRSKRNKKAFQNPLDEIEGIGPKRKKALLEYFGTTKAISNAAIQDLIKVPFISEKIAKIIYDWFQKK